MKRMFRLAAAALLFAGMLSGCHTVPKQAVTGLSPVQPGSGEMVIVNDLYVIVDASGSMFPPEKFMTAKRIMRGLAQAMPEDYYGVQLTTFGGEWEMDWLNLPIETFDRKRIAAGVEEMKFLKGATPLDAALRKLAPGLKGWNTHSAVLIISDGVSCDEAALASARSLLVNHPGPLCFHTIHVGHDDAGAELLGKISGLTTCGTIRHSSAIALPGGMETLVRDIFFAPLLDSDNDGVPDPRDLCPDTPAGHAVNGYGCSSWATVYFDTDKSVVKKQFARELDAVAARLRNSPGVCLRVEGHADSRNEVDYNQRLSDRRAHAVRDALIQRGADPGQLLVQGYSELRPAAPNTSAHNMQLNRRVELIPLP